MLTIYRVQAGDTLGEICESHGLDLAALLELNPQIDNPDVIAIGQPINVPVAEEVEADEEPPEPDLPDWYQLALREMDSGVAEIGGGEHNPRILEYHQTTTLAATDDETAWCSSFVNWCVSSSGLQGTRSAAARSWLNWGRPLDEPATGCIVVLKRGTKPWQGHVGFFSGMSGSHLLILGGNQSNEVNISSYHRNRLLGYRWAND